MSRRPRRRPPPAARLDVDAGQRAVVDRLVEARPRADAVAARRGGPASAAVARAASRSRRRLRRAASRARPATRPGPVDGATGSRDDLLRGAGGELATRRADARRSAPVARRASTRSSSAAVATTAPPVVASRGGRGPRRRAWRAARPRAARPDRARSGVQRRRVSTVTIVARLGADVAAGATVSSTATAAAPGTGIVATELRGSRGRRRGPRSPWPRTRDRRSCRRAAPGLPAHLDRGVGTGTPSSPCAVTLLSPNATSRRPWRTSRGAGACTRRCRGRCRSASPAGTPWPSARGRPRRSASSRAREAERPQRSEATTSTTRIHRSRRSSRPPRSPVERSPSDPAGSGGRADADPGSRTRPGRSPSTQVRPRTQASGRGPVDATATAVPRRARRQRGAGRPSRAAPPTRAPRRRRLRRPPPTARSPARLRQPSPSVLGRIGPRRRPIVGEPSLGPSRSWTAAQSEAAELDERDDRDAVGRAPDRRPDPQPVADARVVRVDRGQDDVHVQEGRHARDHVGDAPAERDGGQDRPEREQREQVALVDPRRAARRTRARARPARRGSSAGPAVGRRAPQTPTHGEHEQHRADDDGRDPRIVACAASSCGEQAIGSAPSGVGGPSTSRTQPLFCARPSLPVHVGVTRAHGLYALTVRYG